MVCTDRETLIRRPVRKRDLALGHWLEPAIGPARRIGTELEGQPVWLFSGGPVGVAIRAYTCLSADPGIEGDFRDWEAVREGAGSTVDQLTQAAA